MFFKILERMEMPFGLREVMPFFEVMRISGWNIELLIKAMV